MVGNVASVMAELEDADFYLLSGLEQGMRFSEWVNLEKLPDYADMTTEETEYRLNRCADRELVERKTMQYEGYRLTFEGYDCLALRSFSERGTIDGVGASLGVGKESDVYEVQSYQPMALKYHREGYTAFRKVDKEREYTADRNHVSWFYTARKAAEREHEVLADLYPDVAVPRPVDQNRHAILMEKFDGVELARASFPAEQVPGVCDLVLREMRDAYRAGYVHADMSQHNVAVADSGITVFDWPQAVATDHENADEFLERDVENVVSFFQRKYPQEMPDEVNDRGLATAIRDGDGEFGSVTKFGK